MTASAHRRAFALGALCTVLFLTFLDTTVVSVALGSVQSDLHAGVTQLQWVVSAYALTFASAMLAAGALGDRIGRKRVLLAGAAVFCAGSVLCALASSPALLIAGRAVMGLGAAASEPGTLSVLRQLYTDDRARARAIGVWAGVSGLALALGPVVGGTLVGLWSWRAIFWFNLAFGLAALVVAVIVLPESADPDATQVDAAGAVLGAAALACFVFAVIDGERAGFRAPSSLVPACLSALAALGFLWWERRSSHPLIDPRLWHNSRFTTANVLAFCAYFATFAIFFFTALYLVEVVGDSGYQITRVFLPMAVLMIVASLAAGRWTAIAGPRWPSTTGCLLFGVGLLLAGHYLNPHPQQGLLMAALALAGIGIGTTVVPITASVLAAVPPQHSGVAASATNTSREIGAVTGVAVLGALVNAQLNLHLADKLRHLGIPQVFQAVVINAVETGGVPSSSHTAGAGGAEAAGQGKLVQEVINAAYSAFHTGLHIALLVSAVLMLGAGVLALVTLAPREKQEWTRPDEGLARP